MKLTDGGGTCLSKGGRLTLAQSVLNGLPCYLFSLLQASVGAINGMEKKVRNFVRTRGSTKSTAHLVKWDSNCRPICYGGLGIGSFEQKNNALFTKWLWRFCKEDNALRRRLIVAIYGLKENAFLLGEGTKSDFGRTFGVRLNPWQKNLLICSPCWLNKDASVGEWSNVNHSWNLGLTRNVPHNEFENVATILEALHLWAPTDDRDSFKWYLNAKGGFTTKSTILI
ncbi:hypothetical protein E5676_scaffold350G00660 [Cucumis melo var. makuwa]|uniref:Reverse transcriptase zinc-binding domain-containing protein n=1 Tax=Cucumis melo var. makuwa TaxID=1194695 RepID=A0A5D3BH84_CUCMM|nr:hypothetical protein E5676_scaffold350G00660 [Cucumis melo var. makuwa]